MRSWNTHFLADSSILEALSSWIWVITPSSWVISMGNKNPILCRLLSRNRGKLPFHIPTELYYLDYSIPAMDKDTHIETIFPNAENLSFFFFWRLIETSKKIKIFKLHHFHILSLIIHSRNITIGNISLPTRFFGRLNPLLILFQTLFWFVIFLTQKTQKNAKKFKKETQQI